MNAFRPRVRERVEMVAPARAYHEPVASRAVLAAATDIQAISEPTYAARPPREYTGPARGLNCRDRQPLLRELGFG
jgi:hypothetical protein